MKTARLSAFELKIKPDFVLLLTAISMWAATLVIPSFDVPVFPRTFIGILLALVGICTIQAAGVSFRQAHTTVKPTHPNTTSSLVISGLYGITRNPMYAGMTLLLLGWAAFLLNLGSFGLIIIFVAYIGRFQIIPEERALYAIFGNKYATYKSRVRRWL